jgi:D-glycero-alpha-D-manno-heptose-7-phosphate kinase
MIWTRSPLRISLGGGGTDLPSYSSLYGGFVISAAINKYVYVGVNRPFAPGISLKYSSIENHEEVEQITHPIIREALKLLHLRTPQIEISTVADIPSGTGLGSSGSFTTALLKALFTHYKYPIHANRIAELACEIEIEKLKEPVGKQDQYIAAHGGIAGMEFQKDNSVEVKPLQIAPRTMFDLEDNLLLFYTGKVRTASSILLDQHTRSLQNELEMKENLDQVKSIGLEIAQALENNNARLFGSLMDEHWNLKRKRSVGMTNSNFDEWYELGRANGALGGKIVGAGGGGFLMFYAQDSLSLRKAMSKVALEELRFKFDFEGTKAVLSS